jgi:hypothetical protein
MNSEPNTIEELAASVSGLARRAVNEYAPLVHAIVCERSQDVRHIEQVLDGLLDFCFDPEVVVLYKRLCRHYYAVKLASAIWYANAYHQMWATGDEKSCTDSSDTSSP